MLSASLLAIAGMAPKGAKSRKLEELGRFRRRVPHASASALSAVLADVKQHGVPDLHRRETSGLLVMRSCRQIQNMAASSRQHQQA